MPAMNVNDFIAATRGQLQRLSHPLALAAAYGDERKFHYQLLLTYKILDPNSEIVLRWNYIFLLTCIAALFIDPLYFFLPSVGDDGACLSSDNSVLASVTVFRTLTDLFYVLNIIIKFRTAFISKSSRVFGTGELVMDPYEIAWRYLKSDFVIDFAASLPLPQVVNWFVIPTLKRNKAEPTNYTLAFIVFVQYIPRFFLMFPLNKRIIKSTGVIAKNAWSGAAYNLLLYMLSSHILGSIWYTTAISRQYSCWRLECDDEKEKFPPCLPKYLDCSIKDDVDRQYWFNNTDVVQHCKPGDKDAVFQFGIFEEAFTSGVGSSIFMKKYLYCLWFGFKNLSSFGTNLETTNFMGETVFCILMCIVGLFLFCLLIGNVQTYLQSLTVRVEEWRIKRTDTEEWMRHRQLPLELQERVRKFIQYYWLSTRGVDEETILRSLPLDLRREIRRHLCLNLVRRVPFFSKMDELLLDAVCERLIATLSTQGTYIFREGDPVDEMLFIIRGQLESSTTGGGRSGFFNCIILRPGDFCGEELLTWALVPNANLSLPSSTRTIKALTEVEAFALMADDLKFFSSQFKRLHSKALQDAFRYHSHQWRTWGACYVQNAWKRYRRKKMSKELALRESMSYMSDEDIVEDDYSLEEIEALASPKQSNTAGSSQHLGATKFTSKFTASARRGAAQRNQVGELSSSVTNDLKMPKMFKPDMPDFS